MRTKIVQVDGSGRNHQVKLKLDPLGTNSLCDIGFQFNNPFLDTDPSKIGLGQPEEWKAKWGEAEQFGEAEQNAYC